MEIIYFTLAAVVLYLAADRILDQIERAAGRRFEQRSLIFFAILLVLAMVSFAVLRHLTGPGVTPAPVPENFEKSEP